MIGFFSFSLKVWLWALVLQWTGRALFLVLKGAYHHLSAAEILQSYLSGFPLDLAFISYFMVFSILVFWIGRSVHQLTARMLFLFVGVLFMQVSLIISLADAELFAVWGTKFNRQALQYLYSPEEAAASASEARWTGIVICWVLFTVFFLRWLFMISKCIVKTKQTVAAHLFTAGKSVVSMALFGIAIRGGFGNVPINQSVAVFSAKPAANMAAINSGWNFLYFLVNKNETINPEKYHFNKSGYDEVWLSHNYGNNTANSSISQYPSPNICIIILESFSAYGSKFLTEKDNAMPFLDSLQQNGLSMKKAYASGDRTDKGLAAVIGGWHGQPWQSILHEPDKASKLPSLAKLFGQKGYQTGFVYGGDLGFANMRSYLFAAGFHTIKDQADFNRDELTSKWGAHDAWSLKKLLSLNNQASKPFFHVLLTLSSHEPYDVPGGPYYRAQTSQKELLNSIAYTDYCIRRFMEEAAKKAWFKNTLFVFVADHGRDLGYPETQFDRAGHFHIPLFFWGEALHPSLRRKASEKVASQCDIAETLNQAVLFNREKQFRFSENLLDPRRQAPAIYIFNSGFGAVANGSEVVFHNQPGQQTFGKGRKSQCDSLLQLGQIFQYNQVKTYLKY